MSQNVTDLIYLKSLFHDHLLRGDASALTVECIRALNLIALRIYEEDIGDDEGKEVLKYIVLICNVLYNRTDMDVLPIEDGFYDLLLEKYKIYDKNFQVGSAVVNFKSTTEKDPNYRKVIQPIRILEEYVPKDDVSHIVRNEILRKKQEVLNDKDLHISPIYFDQGYIEKRTHSTEHSHPSLVGTLDKCKFVFMADAAAVGADKDPNVKILERDFFQKHIDMGIIDPNKEYEIILELKYDGISVEADCTNVVESARTRGDTGMGVAADISPILEGYPFKHARCMIGQKPIGVKFEAIMTRSALDAFSKAKEYNYVNCRTAIVGLFGASDAYKYRDYITLVPLAVDRNDTPQIQDRAVEIEFLNEVFRSNGEPLRYLIVSGTVPTLLFYTKKFLEEAKGARDYLNFMYDGIVVSYRDEQIREALGRENFINKFSMAVKFDPLCKTTTFRGYTYEVGQGGNITPMLHYDPVEFLGTIHTKSSGSSYARFKELDLAYGDHIEVTYRNDVMPYVTKPDCEYNRQNLNPKIEHPRDCPVCGTTLVLSDSEKTLCCPNWYCEGRAISRAANMLAKLNLKGFSENMIAKIGETHFHKLVDLSYDYLSPRIGEGNAANFVELMNRLKTEPIYDYQIIGALGFSGIAAKKWKLILGEIKFKDLIDILIDDLNGNSDAKVNDIWQKMANIKGIGWKITTVIRDELYSFCDDLIYISKMPNVLSCDSLIERKQIRFSGCRDLQLEQQLNNDGYDADSSSGVTKKTDYLIIPYMGYTSTKTKKVSPDCRVIPIEEFRILYRDNGTNL